MLAGLSLVAIVAAMVASVAGFGIGSVLTPTLSAYYPAKLAVAAVSIPHLAATGYRLWLVRAHIDYKILRTFGAMSAGGGLLGAFANLWFSSRILEIVLAVLLIFVGVAGLFGWTKKMRFQGGWAWFAGGVSGFLGGLVGNQGGLRAGSMMGLGVSRDAFVATATATGIIVDLARMPVYLIGQWEELTNLWPQIWVMVAGVLAGTYVGMAVLKRIPEQRFLQVVSVLLVGLGAWLLAKA
ncbi:MAG: sulfite exporter TauE/SafE family protein [Fimbriimonadaceae bacterium]